MKPYYEEAGITIYHGDCREIQRTHCAGHDGVNKAVGGLRHLAAKHR